MKLRAASVGNATMTDLDNSLPDHSWREETFVSLIYFLVSNRDTLNKLNEFFDIKFWSFQAV